MKILLSTRDHNPSQVADVALKLGYDGIELVLPSIEDEDAEKYRYVWGLKAIHASQHTGTAAAFKQSLRHACTLAQSLGVTVVNIHPTSAWSEHGGRPNVIQGIREILLARTQYAHVNVVYEVLHKPKSKPNEQEKAPYKKPAEWLTDILNYQLLGTLDTTHVASWGRNPTEMIGPLGKFLRHVHLSDWNEVNERDHLFLGDGNLDLEGFLHQLALSHYQGYITFEPGSRFKVNENIKNLQQSLAFIKENFK